MANKPSPAPGERCQAVSEVARRLKADARTRSIPIIMVTALEDREARLKGLENGAEEFLTKPVNRAELQMRVKSLLKI